MAKFEVTVELDWIEDEDTIDEKIKEEIILGIVDKVSKNITNSLESRANEILEKKMKSLENDISDRLNKVIEEFLETPKDITDMWGDIIHRDVTVKSILKESCANYLEQKVDSNGNPTKNNYGNNITRVEYVVRRAVEGDLSYAIKRVTDEITKKIKEKVTDEVKTQIGKKLSDAIGIDSMIF